jgi:hypothetical protein
MLSFSQHPYSRWAYLKCAKLRAIDLDAGAFMKVYDLLQQLR